MRRILTLLNALAAIAIIVAITLIARERIVEATTPHPRIAVSELLEQRALRLETRIKEIEHTIKMHWLSQQQYERQRALREQQNEQLRQAVTMGQRSIGYPRSKGRDPWAWVAQQKGRMAASISGNVVLPPEEPDDDE